MDKEKILKFSKEVIAPICMLLLVPILFFPLLFYFAPIVNPLFNHPSLLDGSREFENILLIAWLLLTEVCLLAIIYIMAKTEELTLILKTICISIAGLVMICLYSVAIFLFLAFYSTFGFTPVAISLAGLIITPFLIGLILVRIGKFTFKRSLVVGASCVAFIFAFMGIVLASYTTGAAGPGNSKYMNIGEVVLIAVIGALIGTAFGALIAGAGAFVGKLITKKSL